MAKKRELNLGKSRNEAEELDAVNAAMRTRRQAPEVIRRSMETEIEQQAKKRRGAAEEAKRVKSGK